MKNRHVRIVALAGIPALAFLSGCDLLTPKVVSPFSGQEVTEGGLIREVQREEAKAKAEAESALAKAAREIREAQAAARRASIDLAQRQATTAAELTAEAARVEAETGQKITAATAAAEAASKALADRLALLAEQADASAAELEAKRAKWAAVGGLVAKIPGVQAAAGAAGLDLSGLLSVALGGTTLYAIRRGKKAADAAWDDATAQERARQEAAREREHAAWDAARAEALAGRPA